MGKSFLHLAVEYAAVQIIQFLLFEAEADPNQLTHNTRMSALHLAVSRAQPGLIELLLMCKRTQINLVSDLHGTPLHTACKLGSLKIVQQLLLNNADTQIVATDENVLAKDIAADQRIIALIDRYDQLLLYCQDEPESSMIFSASDLGQSSNEASLEK